MKVALVHDYLNQWGGAERVLEVFLQLWPEAPVFTAVYDKEKLGEHFTDNVVYSSFLGSFPFARRHHRPFIPLMPLAFERFDVRDFDLVISSSASFAKGVLAHSNALHINYCHTPTRFLWQDFHDRAFETRKWFIPDFLMKLGGTFLRMWDFQAAQRPDIIVANSKFVARQISKFYRREAEVLYPPVDAKKFKILNLPPRYEKFFLAVGRFVPHKKFGILIKAFNDSGLKLKIVGSGPEEKKLKKISGPNIDFLGNLTDDELVAAYNYAEALIVPQIEDFGMVTVEAMLCGTPVIAFAAGGSLEIVEEGVSGLFFKEQSPDALNDALKIFRAAPTFDSEKIRASATKFDTENFKRKFKNIVSANYKILKS